MVDPVAAGIVWLQYQHDWAKNEVLVPIVGFGTNLVPFFTSKYENAKDVDRSIRRFCALSFCHCIIQISVGQIVLLSS